MLSFFRLRLPLWAAAPRATQTLTLFPKVIPLLVINDIVRDSFPIGPPTLRSILGRPNCPPTVLFLIGPELVVSLFCLPFPSHSGSSPPWRVVLITDFTHPLPSLTTILKAAFLLLVHTPNTQNQRLVQDWFSNTIWHPPFAGGNNKRPLFAML